MKGDRVLKVLQEEIRVDGLDTTDKLLSMIRRMEVDANILGGITFGGFNVIDPRVIHAETGVPFIVYSAVKPDNHAVLAALRKHFPDWERRWEIIEGRGRFIAPGYSGKDKRSTSRSSDSARGGPRRF
jgi:endonuclease V-like protein UPF0215 family